MTRSVAAWRERLGEEVPVIATSSATGVGLAELADELLRRRARAWRGGPGHCGAAHAAPAGEEQLLEHMVFRPARGGGFTSSASARGAFAVRGRGIERLLARHDVENEDAMAYLEGRLRRIGVLRALEAAGLPAGGRDRDRGGHLRARPLRRGARRPGRRK